jgi:hypothetical protein
MTHLSSLPYKERVGVFTYAGAEEKQECREFKLNCIKPHASKVSSFLTLAADSLSFEEMIMKTFKNASVYAYERNVKVYNQGLAKYKQVKKLFDNIYYKNDDIFNAQFHKHNVVDLDLCGSFTNQTMIDIISAFQSFKSGFVFITLTKQVRNSLLVDNITDYGAKDLQEFRDIVFAKYLKNLCGLEQYCEPYIYANKSVNKKAKEMITYVFTKSNGYNWAENKPSGELLIPKK